MVEGIIAFCLIVFFFVVIVLLAACPSKEEEERQKRYIEEAKRKRAEEEEQRRKKAEEEQKRKAEEEERQRKRAEKQRKKEEEQRKINDFKEQYFNPIIKNLTEEQKEDLAKFCNKNSQNPITIYCNNDLKQYQKFINNKPFLLQEMWDIFRTTMGGRVLGAMLWRELFREVYLKLDLEFPTVDTFDLFNKWTEKENNIYFPLYYTIYVEYISSQGKSLCKKAIDLTDEELVESWEIYEEKF